MKIIIRIIAVIALSFAILFAAGFIMLKQGINISELSILNAKIKNAHLIWNNRLKLEIDSIAVQPNNKNASEESSNGEDISYVSDVLQAIDLIEEWFSFINLKKITLGSMHASFHFQEDENGQLIINSPQFKMQTRIHTESEFLLFDINTLSSAEYKSHAQGKVRINTDEDELTATFEAMIADTLPLQLEVKANTESMSFSGKGTQAVASIAPVVELFDLGPDVTPWISEYLVASEISLTTVSGSVEYDEPESILQTLHAAAKVKDTEYTFAQGLEPIKAAETDVEFVNGVLKILPHDASFYGQNAGSSKLDINFNNEPFVLTAYIRTKAQASGGILTLLDFYDIPFPYVQKKGLTDTDLTLAINLSTIEIDAQGTFKSDNSVFEYENELFNINSLNISLKDTDIFLHQLNINKNEQISARVSGTINAEKREGDLKISIDKFFYQAPHAAIELDNMDKSPLLVNYQMSPDGDSISAGKSSWKRDKTRLNIGKFTVPFDPETWTVMLPPTRVSFLPSFKTSVSGTFSKKAPYADIKIKILELKQDKLHLQQPGVEVKVLISEDIILTTKKTAHILSDKTVIKLLPTSATYADDVLQIMKSGLEIDNQFFSDVTGKFDLNTNTGQLQLDKLRITDKPGGNLLAVSNPVEVNLSLQKNRSKVNVPLLGIEFLQQQQQGWSLIIKDLARLNKFSPFMQDYRLQEGELKLSSKNNALPWLIEGKINYPEALLIDGNEPVYEYQFNGNYDGTNTSLNINDKVHIKFADKVSISSENIGYNLPALIKVANQQDDKPAREINENTNKNSLDLTLKAKNSFISLDENKRILAEVLQLSTEQDLISGDIKYGEGSASLELKDSTLSIIGDGFEKTFINELVTLADFGRGEMDFTLSGELDDMDVVFRIRNALIKDYKTLNNILAFINTVPALVTFKVPNYSRKGLPAEEIYVGANYKDGLIEARTVFIDSKEIDLRGSGVANLNDDSVDMVFNVITGTKKSVQTIPLLGYVLAGDKKSPSITLTVKGNLSNPVIKHTTFKEVAVYPLNVLKNTVKLPGHLINKVRKKSDAESQGNNKMKSGTIEEEELY